MGMALTCMEELRNAYKILFRGLRIGRIDVDGSILFNWVLRKFGRIM
jgi:hypothetical protein